MKIYGRLFGRSSQLLWALLSVALFSSQGVALCRPLGGKRRGEYLLNPPYAARLNFRRIKERGYSKFGLNKF